MCNDLAVRALDEDNSKRFVGAHTCDPSTLDVKVGASRVQSQFWLHSKVSRQAGIHKALPQKNKNNKKDDLREKLVYLLYL